MRHLIVLAAFVAAAAAQQIDYDREIRNKPIQRTSEYDFPPVKPTNSISAGVATISLSKCPLGVGGYIFAPTLTVSGAANNGSGLVRITVAGLGHTYSTGDTIITTGVGGVTGANVTRIITVISKTTYDIQGSTFSGAYTSGGTSQRAPHYVYLSGGTGAAEAVAVIGGTCVHNATTRAAGTLQVLAANAHSGAYTLRSATAGIQEAIILDAPQVQIPNGTTTMYATVTIDGTFQPNVKISGVNQSGSILRRAAGMTNQDIFRILNDAGPVFEDFSITNTNLVAITGGAAFRFANGILRSSNLHRIRIRDERIGVLIQGFNSVSIDGYWFSQSPSYEALGAFAVAGVYVQAADFHSTAEFNMSDFYIVGNGVASANTLSYGVYIEQADGTYLSDGVTSGLNVGIAIVSVPGVTMNYIQVHDVELDFSRTTALQVLNTGGATYFQNIKFTGLAVQYSASTSPLIQFSGPFSAGGVILADSYISSGLKDCLTLTDVQNVSITGNIFTSCNYSNTTGYDLLVNGATGSSNLTIGNNTYTWKAADGYAQGVALLANVTGLTYTGNNHTKSFGNGLIVGPTFTLSSATITGNRFANSTVYGLFGQGNLTNTAISGNTFTANTANSMGLTGTMTNLSLGPNSYQETTPETVASAATITLPTTNFLDTAIISGTTGITRILGGWSQRQIKFQMQGAVTFSTGGANPGDIGRTFGPTVAGQMVTATYQSDGKWYLQ